MNRFNIITTFFKFRALDGFMVIKPRFDLEAVFGKIYSKVTLTIDSSGQWNKLGVSVDLSSLLESLRPALAVTDRATVNRKILVPLAENTDKLNAENIFLPPIALTGVLFPFAFAMITVGLIYENKSDPSLNIYYGIKKPEGTITPHKRKFHKEFLLPPTLLKSNLIEILHIKDPTFAQVNIYSDFVFYRGRINVYLNLSSRVALSAITFPVALQISIFVTTKYVFLLIEHQIICSILGYLFAASLTSKAIEISTFVYSFSIRGVFNFGLFLTKKSYSFFLNRSLLNK